jgi:hypothetical protein
MLLCAHHHQLVDNDVEKYSVEMLREMKANHESRVASALRMATPWSERWRAINYLNVPRLSMFSAISGVALRSPFTAIV